MFRKACTVALVATLLGAVPLGAQTRDTRPQAAHKSSSTGKRVAWTLIGAGAGFAAGVFLGLNQFDDAINSDRKVWATAIACSAGGAIVAALLSRNVGKTPSIKGVS